MAVPFRDNLAPRRFPWVTFALIVTNCVVFLFLQPSAFQVAPDELTSDGRAQFIDGSEFAMTWAMVPCEVMSGSPVSDHPEQCDMAELDDLPPHVLEEVLPEKKSILLTLLTSMFLHGSIEHLAGNMLFLWVFGKNVEDRLGPLVYTGLYLLGGLAGGLTSVFTSQHSAIPHLGASGAIAAAMGAYLICYPRSKILTQMVLPIQVVYVPAAIVLILFFVTQFFIGSDSNVAWEAHAGGMVAGAVLALGALRLPPVKRLARTDGAVAAAATTSSF